MAGWFAERTWDRNPVLASFGFAAASIIPFVFGVPCLAFILSTVLGVDITFASVMEAVVLPFIAGGIIKAAFAALLVPMAGRGVHVLDARK